MDSFSFFALFIFRRIVVFCNDNSGFNLIEFKGIWREEKIRMYRELDKCLFDLGNCEIYLEYFDVLN